MIYQKRPPIFFSIALDTSLCDVQCLKKSQKSSFITVIALMSDHLCHIL